MIASPVRIESLEGRPFTATYSQPDEYHFCLDSIIFAKFVSEQVFEPARVLDVCAGCGVIGLELARYYSDSCTIDFLEKQNEFRPFFDANRLDLARRKLRFVHGDFRDLQGFEFRDRYDLIVANPPYFLEGEGLLSPSALRNRCRFFLDGCLSELCVGIVSALKWDASAYLLVKDGQRHGRDSLQTIREAVGTVTVEVVAIVRGTPVVKLTKSRA